MKRRDIIIISVIGAIILSATISALLTSIYFSKLKVDKSNQQSVSTKILSINNKTDLSSEGSTIPDVPKLMPINISEDQQQMIGVQTGVVSVKPMMKLIRTIGRVNYDESKLATINTFFDGYIEKLYVNTTGQYVKKGQAIAEIYSPELLSTQMEFINLLKWRKKDKTKSSSSSDYDQISDMLSKDADNVMEASKQRLKLFGINEKQINQVEKTQKPKRTLTVYSPANGFVIQKQALQGTRVRPGQALFDIADLSTVWIIADIYEQDLPLIKIGQKVTINFPYYPNKTFISTISYVYPTLDNVTRTAKIRLVLPNPKGIFKPQMYSDMEISVGLGNKLSVPESAVINTGKRKIVYVDKGNGDFEQRTVKTGFNANNMIQILSGLKAGEVVSTSANFLINSEARLKGGAD